MDNILRIRIPFLTQDVRIDTNFKVIAQQINALPRDNTISDEKIKDGTISQKKLSFTLTEMGTLDDLNDGAYGKILSTEISAGHINLMAVSVVDPSFTTDKIGEGDSHKWDTGIPPTILDQLADGTYKKVLAADFTAEHIKLAAITQDTTHRVVTDTEKGTWNGKPDDMDAIGQGSTYWKLAQTEIEAGHIRLSTAYGTLDNIANGADYGKVALTSIGAGKIIVAGLDNDVTARMFADGDAKTDIEAWRHASDVTLIDGGDIYADSITLGSIKSDAFSSLANRNLIQNSSFDKDVSDTWPMTYWDCDKTGGTFYRCSNWAATENHKKYPWDFVFYCHVAAENNDGSQYVSLISSDYIPVDITKPYTLSTWIKRQGDVLRWFLGLIFYDSDKVACDPVIAYPASMSGITTTGTTTYTHYSGTFGPGMDVEFPANCRYVRIIFYPMHSYGSGSSIGSMSTGLQFEPGDHVTDWKPYLLPEQWAHGTDATYIDGGKIYTHSIECDKLLVGSDANSEDTLDVWQGEDDTQILRLRSTSINHQITQGGGLGYDWGTYTDCYYYLRKFDAGLGGVHCASFTEAAGNISYQVYAIYGDAVNVKNGNADGPINFASLRADPANHGYQKCESDDNIFVLKTKPFATDTYQAIFIVDEDGDVLYDGAAGAFQNEDDIKLLGELEDILGSKISKEEMKEKDVFKKHKIINVAEVDAEDIKENKVIKTGKKRLDRFVSTKRLNMLLMGSIRQLSERINELEKKELN